MALKVRKASRSQKFLKMLITGQSGAGKTLGALLIANGLLRDIPPEDRKIFVFDTEDGRSELKADTEYEPGKKLESEFDISVFDPKEEGRPVNGLDYKEAVEYAEKNGYHVVILDSISHEWDYIKTEAEKNGNTKFGNNWNSLKSKFHRPFKDAVRHSKIHVISTARAKTNRQQTQDGKVLKESGDVMTQPDAPFEYDFIFDIMNRDHITEVDKTEGGLFLRGNFIITEKTGETIANWLNSAGDQPEEIKYQKISNPQNKTRIQDLLKDLKEVGFNFPVAKVKEFTALVSEGKAKEVAELTIEQCNEVVYSIIVEATESEDTADDCKLHFGSTTERKDIKQIISSLHLHLLQEQVNESGISELVEA